MRAWSKYSYFLYGWHPNSLIIGSHCESFQDACEDDILETKLPAVRKSFLPAGVISSFSRVYSLTSLWVEVYGERKTNNNKKYLLEVWVQSSHLPDTGKKTHLSLDILPEIARSFWLTFFQKKPQTTPTQQIWDRHVTQKHQFKWCKYCKQQKTGWYNEKHEVMVICRSEFTFLQEIVRLKL